MNKFLMILVLLIPASAFSAPVTEKYVPLPTPIAIEEGRVLYQENGCPMCHGDQGRGDGPLASGLSNKPRMAPIRKGGTSSTAPISRLSKSHQPTATPPSTAPASASRSSGRMREKPRPRLHRIERGSAEPHSGHRSSGAPTRL